MSLDGASVSVNEAVTTASSPSNLTVVAPIRCWRPGQFGSTSASQRRASSRVPRMPPAAV